jgi:hypothetical protein
MAWPVVVGLRDHPEACPAGQLGLHLLPRLAEPALTALHVCPVRSARGALVADLAGMLGFQPVLVPPEVEAAWLARGQAALDAFAAAAGRPLRCRLEQGDVVQRLVHHADGARLLIVGRSGPVDTWAGEAGVVPALLRQVRGDVLVGAPRLPRLDRLLVPLDASDGARLALRAAAGLALQLGAAIDLLQVGAPPRGADPLPEALDLLADFGVPGAAHRADGELWEVVAARVEADERPIVAVAPESRSAVGQWLRWDATRALLDEVNATLLVAG